LTTLPNKFGIHGIPGRPLISVEDNEATLEFLRRELLHDRLNALAPIFFFVASPGHADISPLHHQIIRGRDILITEDPGLHLLWYYDRIFIKPLPPYLTSHAFWKKFLSGQDTISSELRRSGLGYLRSYFYLIQHRSDYEIALEKRLVGQGTSFDDLMYFLRSFQAISDEQVTPRYRYGELRLSRLNFWSRLYRFELFYQKLHGQYGPYFAEIVAPFLYIFAIISVTLTSMQTMLAVQQLDFHIAEHSARAIALVSWWFSICCMFLSSVCVVFLPTILLLFLLRELVYSLTHMARGKPESEKAKA
jgi:hypothetical protein